MRLVTVEDIKAGDILAKDVLLEDYTILLGKGTELKEAYIEKLRDLNIVTVYIEEPKEEEEAESRLSLEVITILREDVEEKVKNKVKDILELHVYQKTEGLKEIADTAQKVISDILSDKAVVEKVYDVKERSADIYEHSLTICTIATLIALKLELTEKEIYDIGVSSLLHDLGLRYLVLHYEDQDINLLPAKDQEEYRKHPIYAYTAVKKESWISEEAKNLVLSHKEHIDGSGYPMGTDVVSRSAQIIGVCDEFDEMICGIGKARVRVHEAISTIRNYSGIWFEDDIVKAFLGLIAVYPAGSKVMTNQKELAVVMKQNPSFPERPVLRVISDKFGQPIKEEKIIDLVKDTSVVIQQVVK
ncbi:MAG: HD domain-containing protein [Lachnospiraceae bacterium]|nr:HD domain-containing protein [Lachnospiraceae bacterium]